MMSQSWMGTDFTNDDLVGEFSVVNDYTHKFVGEETIAGRSCWIVGDDTQTGCSCGVGKGKVWIDKKITCNSKVENYDEDGYLVNSMLAYDIKNLGGRMILPEWR